MRLSRLQDPPPPKGKSNGKIMLGHLFPAKTYWHPTGSE